MDENGRPKEQLIQEVEDLRRRIVELERTEIKHLIAEKALRESEEKFQLIADNSNDWIYLIKPDKTFIYVSPSSKRLTGYPSEEFINNPDLFLNIIHPDDQELVKSHLEIIPKEPQHHNLEFRIITREGELRWIRHSCLPVHNDQGQYIGRSGTNRDITNRKQTEAALRESEERYRTAIEQSNDGVALVKGDRHIYVNQKMVEIFGYDRPEEFIGHPHDMMIHPDDQERVRDINRRRQKGETVPQKYELKGRRKNGDLVYIEVSATKVTYQEEPVTLAFLRDITDRKLAEEKIKVLLKEKELLLQEVHHRIKNNMSTMMSLLSLQSNTLEDPKAVAALEDAKSRLKSMAILYDKLYRTENLREMSIKDYLPDLIHEIAGIFPNKASVKIETRIDDFILGVKVLSPLGIIVNELITNAMKYAFIGKDVGLIIVSATAKGHLAAIVIEDNGSGLVESVDIETTSGFGLQLVGHLAKQIDGTIRIERGKGTRFVLEFGI